LRFGLSGEGLVAAVFSAVLVLLAAIDLEQRIVPNRIVLPALGVVLVGSLIVFPDKRFEFIVATLGAGLLLLLPLLAYPAGMGMGDVKLAMLLGAGLGVSVITAFVVAFLTAFIFAVAILARGGVAARKTGIPFAPFLALGGLVALFLGG